MTAVTLGLEQFFRVQLTTESLTLYILLLTFLHFLVFHLCTIFRRRRVRAWTTKALRYGCIQKRPVTTNSWVPVLNSFFLNVFSTTEGLELSVASAKTNCVWFLLYDQGRQAGRAYACFFFVIELLGKGVW
jgi:hypothetical protein